MVAPIGRVAVCDADLPGAQQPSAARAARSAEGQSLCARLRILWFLAIRRAVARQLAAAWNASPQDRDQASARGTHLCRAPVDVERLQMHDVVEHGEVSRG